jgi:hypothetical protein
MGTHQRATGSRGCSRSPRKSNLSLHRPTYVGLSSFCSPDDSRCMGITASFLLGLLTVAVIAAWVSCAGPGTPDASTKEAP